MAVELRNKLWAYWRVRGSGRRRAAGSPLPARVATVLRVAPVDPGRAVFELEGIAFHQTRAAWATGSAPQGLLNGEEARGLPEESLILLHSGMGLALAIHLFRPLGRIASRRPAAAFHAVDTALASFLDACRANARPAYLPVTREALGLAVRMFQPRLAAAVNAGLCRVDPDLAAGFWHGAGRALYFRPSHLLPGGLARAVAGCRREPPATPADNRLDALAGLAFAVAMVNLGHPKALERLLAQVEESGEEGEATEASAAITSGVVGCLLARHHTTPADPALAAFLAHRPADPRRREPWERRVSAPGAAALARLYPALRAGGRLGDFARFQRLQAVEESLREDRRCALGSQS